MEQPQHLGCQGKGQGTCQRMKRHDRLGCPFQRRSGQSQRLPRTLCMACTRYCQVWVLMAVVWESKAVHSGYMLLERQNLDLSSPLTSTQMAAWVAGASAAGTNSTRSMYMPRKPAACLKYTIPELRHGLSNSRPERVKMLGRGRMRLVILGPQTQACNHCWTNYLLAGDVLGTGVARVARRSTRMRLGGGGRCKARLRLLRFVSAGNPARAGGPRHTSGWPHKKRGILVCGWLPTFCNPPQSPATAAMSTCCATKPS